MEVRVFSFLLLTTTLIGLFFGASESANVLCVFTSPGKSHLIVFMAVANTLIERGHNVTIITTIPLPNRPTSPLVRHIQLDQPDESLNRLRSTVAQLAYPLGKIEGSKSFIQSMRLLTVIQWNAMDHPLLHSFLEEDNHFDLMIHGYFNNYYQLGFAARYKCPIAVISVGPPFGPLNGLVANPEEVSYVPLTILGTQQPMSFATRVKNFIYASTLLPLRGYIDGVMEKFYNHMFPPHLYPSFSDMMRNISLLLYNGHFTEMPVRPNVPALIEIGGIQIKDTPDPLPEKIRLFIEKKDTILFSLGSTTRGIDMNIEKAETIFNTFSKLEQNVIWKWESDKDFPGISPNIFYIKWLPQDDILAHPNLKLFITNGDKGSIIESRYHGVPMIGIPLFADQPFNVKDMVGKGYGIQLAATTLTADSLTRAINGIFQNPVYAKTVQRFSALYRDRPMTAKNTAAFWLEYVIRHKGARHMRSPALDLNFFQKFSIDAIVFIAFLAYAMWMLAKGFAYSLSWMFVHLCRLRASVKIKKN